MNGLLPSIDMRASSSPARQWSCCRSCSRRNGCTCSTPRFPARAQTKGLSKEEKQKTRRRTFECEIAYNVVTNPLDLVNLICNQSIPMQIQQNSCLQILQFIWLHPWFFSMRELHIGHFFVLARIQLAVSLVPIQKKNNNTKRAKRHWDILVLSTDTIKLIDQRVLTSHYLSFVHFWAHSANCAQQQGSRDSSPHCSAKTTQSKIINHRVKWDNMQ